MRGVGGPLSINLDDLGSFYLKLKCTSSKQGVGVSVNVGTMNTVQYCCFIMYLLLSVPTILTCWMSLFCQDAGARLVMPEFYLNGVRGSIALPLPASYVKVFILASSMYSGPFNFVHQMI